MKTICSIESSWLNALIHVVDTQDLLDFFWDTKKDRTIFYMHV